jgi:hypothetical protein
MKTLIRLTVNTGPELDTTLEARRVCDFLFDRCPGNVAEQGVLMFLRRSRHESHKYPWTAAASSASFLSAAEAVGE